MFSTKRFNDFTIGGIIARRHQNTELCRSLGNSANRFAKTTGNSIVKSQESSAQRRVEQCFLLPASELGRTYSYLLVSDLKKAWKFPKVLKKENQGEGGDYKRVE